MNTFQDIQIGQTAALSREISAKLIEDFAVISGDDNPAHLDEAFAAKTIFRKRIAHGMLAGSLVSALLGARLPGPGAIYLSQSFEFKAPAFIGDQLTAEVRVLEKEEKHKKIKLATTVVNQDGKLILDGLAWVLFRK